MPNFLKRNKTLLISLFFVFIYLLTHLYSLTILPVFADESIYIRWSQLIIDDWKQYLFFPLNDGKTPATMWLMVPFLRAFTDQLFAGRLLSVLIGLGQIFVIKSLICNLGGRDKAQWLGVAMTTFLPFWFFHHRMALTDPLLTFFLSLTLLFLIKSTKKFQSASSIQSFVQKSFFTLLAAGISFGLALLSKIPALLFAPVFVTMSLLTPKISLQKRFQLLSVFCGVFFIGLVIFTSLKIHPAFGQLFSRGGDFLFTFEEILKQGEWRQSFKNIPTFFSYLSAYLTLPVLFLSFSGLFFDSLRRKQAVLLLSTFAFLSPMVLLGRVVYPRYLLPASIFLTVAAVLAFQTFTDHFITHQKTISKKILSSFLLLQLLSLSVLSSFNFVVPALFEPDMIPFVKIDQTQYLHEWSSGHGIVETVSAMQNTAKHKKLFVATEGYFGTLPDGLLMYFHNQNVENIFIEGIGQPILELPENLKTQSQRYDEIWLVANSHRMKMNLDPKLKISEFCRPDTAPCLQIWDITSLVKIEI